MPTYFKRVIIAAIVAGLLLEPGTLLAFNLTTHRRAYDPSKSSNTVFQTQAVTGHLGWVGRITLYKSFGWRIRYWAGRMWIEQDGGRPPRGESSLAAALDSALKSLAKKNELARLSIAADIDGSLPRVKIRQDLLGNVLKILLRFAAHAAVQEETPLAISARQSGNDVIITVADRGDGIPADVLLRIFEHGYTNPPGGRQTDLWVAKQIIEEVGGDITAASLTPADFSDFKMAPDLMIEFTEESKEIVRELHVEIERNLVFAANLCQLAVHRLENDLPIVSAELTAIQKRRLTNQIATVLRSRQKDLKIGAPIVHVENTIMTNIVLPLSLIVKAWNSRSPPTQEAKLEYVRTFTYMRTATEAAVELFRRMHNNQPIEVGTTFTIRLPVAAPPETPAAKPGDRRKLFQRTA